MKKFRKAPPLSASLKVPDNTPFAVPRMRSAGVLSSGEVAQYRADGRALAFDPMLHGWVPADCDDDLTQLKSNALAPRRTRAAHQQASFALRAWGLGDVAAYIDLLDDPEVWRFMPEEYPNPITRELATALIELSNGSNHHQVFAVEHSGQPIGQVRLEFDVEPDNPSGAEISYWLGRAHWGKGMGSEIVQLFTARCFRDNLNLTSLIAKVHRDNIGSLKALRKAGYKIEGDDPKHPDWLLLRLMRD